MSIEPCIKQNTVFATTPAEFNLTARSGRPGCSHTRNSVDQPIENLTELIRLRSSAFWQLRQSITQDGEGFVRRMRDYEGSRSRQNIHLKIKEAEKRGRKRLSSKKRTTIYPDDNDDDDDIHICFGDSSSNIPKILFRSGNREHVTMDVDSRHQLDSSSTWNIRSCPSCRSQCSSNLQLDFFTPTQDTEPRFPSSIVSPSSNSGTTDSSPTISPLSLTTDDLPLLSTSCHKVIAALNLALANGAGSIEDYSPLWEYQSRSQTDCDHGELWHWISIRILCPDHTYPRAFFKISRAHFNASVFIYTYLNSSSTFTWTPSSLLIQSSPVRKIISFSIDDMHRSITQDNHVLVSI